MKLRIEEKEHKKWANRMSRSKIQSRGLRWPFVFQSEEIESICKCFLRKVQRKDRIFRNQVKWGKHPKIWI
jgi:hypothetical protein